MSRYYDDEDEVDVRIRHRADSPPPRRSRGYYSTGPGFLVPQRTVVTTRSRSRERRSSPPRPAPANPIVIHNINRQDDDSSSDDGDRRRGAMVPRHRSHSRAGSEFVTREQLEIERQRSEIEDLRFQRARAEQELELHSRRNDREDWEMERMRRELELVRIDEEEKSRRLRSEEEAEALRAKRELDALKAERERDLLERQRRKEFQSQAELEAARRRLDEIEEREERELEEKRIKRELELKALEAQKKAAEEKERKERLEKETIERYKLKEAERVAKEKREKEEAEKEYKRRLQEDLLRSGVDEKDIKAILEKKSIKERKEKEEKEKEKKKTTEIDIHVNERERERPTYTRMARRYLSIETLNYYHVDFEYDTDPNFVLVRRWVPEEERELLWNHTRTVRESRKVMLKIDDGHRHRAVNHLEPEFEWVRKKERRRSRSKSPGLLMYLAGAK